MEDLPAEHTRAALICYPGNEFGFLHTVECAIVEYCKDTKRVKLFLIVTTLKADFKGAQKT